MTTFSTTKTPKCYKIFVDGGTTYGSVNLTTFTKPVSYCQINNLSSTNVYCKLNGDANAVFTLEANTTQILNGNDITVTSIDFDNGGASGESGHSGVDSVNIEILVGLLQ